MRTTVTLDPDVEASLRRAARERGISFKEALNSAVRTGLAGGRTPKPYQAPVFALHALPGVNLDKAHALAAELEDTETIRELERRK